MRPSLVLLAGPNGAGKTTLYQTQVAPSFAGPFINAYLIQRDELKDATMEASYRAAQIATERRAGLLEARKSFATETVFSHPSKLDIITEARSRGYMVIVMHVGLMPRTSPSPVCGPGPRRAGTTSLNRRSGTATLGASP